MSTSNIDNLDTSKLAHLILDTFMKDVGSDVADHLTSPDRALIEAVSRDAAAIVLLALVDSPVHAAAEKVHVDAQLLNLSSVQASFATEKFWKVIETVVGRVLTMAIGLA